MSLVCSFSLPGSNFYKFFNSWVIVMLWSTVDSILVTLELWIIVLITWSINCNVWFYSNCLWRVLSLYQISGFVYFRKPASVLATANTRRLLSVLGSRGGIIPFRDGERRLVKLGSGTPIPLTFWFNVTLNKDLTNPKLLRVLYIDLLTYLIMAKTLYWSKQLN